MTAVEIDAPFDEQQMASLFALCDVPAPSGYEQPALDVWLARARELGADEVRSDVLGNGIAVFGAGRGPRIMLAGHLDEIGFVVTHITEQGMLRVQEVGGWDPAVPVGLRINVLTDDGVVHGGVCRTAIHLMSSDEQGRTDRLEKLWVDIGATSADEARALVRIGDPVVANAEPIMLAGGRLMSRSLDNRLGSFVVLEAARLAADSGCEVIATGAVSEETTGIGAAALSAGVSPDWAIAVDVCPTSDTPGDHDEEIVLGGGPTITFGAGARSLIGRQLLDSARRAQITVQVTAAGRHTMTDAEDIAMAGSGVPTGVVSVPTRNLHTPCETCMLADVRATVDLLVAWVCDRVSDEPIGESTR